MVNVAVEIEIRLSRSSRSAKERVRRTAQEFCKRKNSFRAGPDQDLLRDLGSLGVEAVFTNLADESQEQVAYFQASSISINIYRTYETELCQVVESEQDGQGTSLFRQRMLPCKEYDGLWEQLMLPDGVKPSLLNYSKTSLYFSEKRVDHRAIAFNNLILLGGPPGGGKTSVCQALAQKLSIRRGESYPHGCFLLEVNAHSIFSRWFSESGKMVNSMFDHFKQLARKKTLIFILIDEVESLTMSRSRESSSDPSDAIRVVNSMLTGLDSLRKFPNILVLGTTNTVQQIDQAFVDRADLYLHLGHPNLEARKKILKSCMDALVDAGVVLSSSHTSDGFTSEHWISRAAEVSEGVSGRFLRKVPFRAHAFFVGESSNCTETQMAEAFFLCLNGTSNQSPE